MPTGFVTIAEIPCDPARATVFEHGWQSWSPTGSYPAATTAPRPVDPHAQIRNYRPERPAPPHGFQGEGLVAVRPAPDAPVTLFHLPDPAGPVPSIRVAAHRDRLMVTADGPVDSHVVDTPGGIPAALDRYAARVADDLRLPAPDPSTLPTVWCSWYCHWSGVTEQHIAEVLADLDTLDLPVDVVQVDDGYQSQIGDWCTPSDRFASVSGVATRIRDHGRRAGIWTAPFLATERSRVVAEHPDWFCAGLDAGVHWGQKLYALDVTNESARAHLFAVFRELAGYGFDYFKVDFVYAGALPARRREEIDPLTAYRMGIDVIREAIGDATLVGCGAPMIPSIGLFDAVRTSPDVDPRWLPADGEASAPAMRNAVTVGEARRFTRHWWVADPDCLIARPEVARRTRWAAHVRETGGLVSVSDRLSDLDDVGLALYRRALDA